jgi:2-oxoglutarate ferredoxin oxidoreductase subunit alpha
LKTAAKIINDDLSIVLSGEAGQGIQSIETLLTTLLKMSGYNIFATKEYMSRVRGGVNSTEIRVSSKKVSAYIDRIDILIPLNDEAIKHLKPRISDETIIIGEKEKINIDEMIDIPFTKLALEIGNPLVTNTIAAGVIAGLLNIDRGNCGSLIDRNFSSKKDDVIRQNRDAMNKGYDFGLSMCEGLAISLATNRNVSDEMMISGSDAIALGAVAGGCDYVCGYPMSPSTGVLERMAAYSADCGAIVEQVEDEVGVINMALGAWYAGARAMVTTSGGGLALMSEGISLCGMIESPMVIHLAQRPGPATGLPTRTEQGDLNLALYSGHGDFPRIILAPGTLEQGYTLSQKAFDLADKFQVPVFILTDQYFVDSYYNTPAFESPNEIQKYFVKTSEQYKRYAINDSGISPRGIPGFGSGNVCVDSDEHNEEGRITENADMRVAMVDKRMRKVDAIRNEVILPELIGDKEYSALIVCWGSTRNIVAEAVQRLGVNEIAVLHFSWIFPLPEGIERYFNKAKSVLIIENNVTSQFGSLLAGNAGINVQFKILKYNGLPFSVEEICDRIRASIGVRGKYE